MLGRPSSELLDRGCRGGQQHPKLGSIVLGGLVLRLESGELVVDLADVSSDECLVGFLVPSVRIGDLGLDQRRVSARSYSSEVRQRTTETRTCRWRLSSS